MSTMKILLAGDKKFLSHALIAPIKNDKYSIVCAYEGDCAIKFLDGNVRNYAVSHLLKEKGSEFFAPTSFISDFKSSILIAKTGLAKKIGKLVAVDDKKFLNPLSAKRLLIICGVATQNLTELGKKALEIKNSSSNENNHALSTKDGIRLTGKSHREVQRRFQGQTDFKNAVVTDGNRGATPGDLYRWRRKTPFVAEKSNAQFLIVQR